MKIIFFIVFFGVFGRFLCCAQRLRLRDLVIPMQSHIYFQFGMYAEDDVTVAFRSRSFVQFNGDIANFNSFLHEKSGGDFLSSLEMILIESNDLKHVGFVHDHTISSVAEAQQMHKDIDNLSFCCSDEAASEGLCQDPGYVLYDSVPSLYYVRREVKGNEVVNMFYDFNITKTGMYYLILANCELNGNDLHINTLISAKNPYGYIPGQYYSLLPFYTSLSVFYAALAIVWLVLSVIYWRDMTNLQNSIAIVILCGMIESDFMFAYWDDYNRTGTSFQTLFTVGSIFNKLKASVSRILVLVVCMGYGVVRPTLGSDGYKVIVLGGVYFISSILESVTKLYYMNHTISSFVYLIFIIPVAALDTAFIWLIFLHLSRIITKLEARRHVVKLGMYRIFGLTLVFSVLFSILFALDDISWQSTYDEDKDWKDDWIRYGNVYWQFLYFFILLIIAIIWRPNSNNLRYAYQPVEDGSDYFDNDDGSNGNNNGNRNSLESSHYWINDIQLRSLSNHSNNNNNNIINSNNSSNNNNNSNGNANSSVLPPAEFDIGDDERQMEMSKLV